MVISFKNQAIEYVQFTPQLYEKEDNNTITRP
jgi:hypothetical protein